ncbi:MFS transporter [Marinobacterium nitratireducens]|uniref:3-methyl-2-oxobutanoate dehydrogenase (2-methylpropanoyl-transferring) n=1 Tax=Marinobacterium nitratireducens TaxID=518897 RepID=A0A918DPN9_9GAMM|nr:alpha-ketoacid dehydrogenase subunit alpha/beta [Marinobacterium nitratireducens]GGO76697.1 MFS transporter [Marinobacterium nitratireducens]
MKTRAEIVDANFQHRVLARELPTVDPSLSPAGAGLEPEALLALFDSQLLSRHLDLCSRRLQSRGQSFYTIGSAGHEGSAAIAAALRPTDMAFLHYRDAAFLIHRASQAGQDPLPDMLLSFMASREDPVSGGRHKVLGSRSLSVPPQTSTVASHLPKALGAAYSIPLARRLSLAAPLPADSLIVCSFGDASANHSTALGAINSACWAAHQQVPLPLIFVCEDNGIGISTPTPPDWIRAAFGQRPGLHYLYCDGLNLVDTYRAAQEAERLARVHHRPVFLHMGSVRLLGHAGSDAETGYRSLAEIEATEARDPLLYSARLLVDSGLLSPQQVVARYREVAARVDDCARSLGEPQSLRDAADVMSTLLPPRRQAAPARVVDESRFEELFARDRVLMREPQPMARLLNWTLAELMAEYPEILLMGEDIGIKGGVYNVTGKLSQRFGRHRVIDTLLDEQSILGLAIGAAHNGFVPIPEIQFLAYVHNAEDQLRGEAATLPFFSRGQFSNPMVVRIAGLGYQRGFGGHFHNDNSLAVFRDIPGLILACPSNGRDAAAMLRESVRLAREEQRVVVFLEPIARYMTRDLHREGDGLWSFEYPRVREAAPIPFGEPGIRGDGRELAILSYGNGHYLSCQAARELERRHGVALRLIDLRWLAPLNGDAIVAAVRDCRHLLIVDECRRSGSVSEALVTLFSERLTPLPPFRRLCAEDSFIPLGPAYAATLPSKASIIAAALELLGRSD